MLWVYFPHPSSPSLWGLESNLFPKPRDFQGKCCFLELPLSDCSLRTLPFTDFCTFLHMLKKVPIAFFSLLSSVTSWCLNSSSSFRLLWSSTFSSSGRCWCSERKLPCGRRADASHPLHPDSGWELQSHKPCSDNTNWSWELPAQVKGQHCKLLEHLLSIPNPCSTSRAGQHHYNDALSQPCPF